MVFMLTWRHRAKAVFLEFQKRQACLPLGSGSKGHGVFSPTFNRFRATTDYMQCMEPLQCYFTFTLQSEPNLDEQSTAVLSQIRLIDAKRLRRMIGYISENDIALLKPFVPVMVYELR